MNNRLAGLLAAASNIREGENPPFDVCDFFALMPEFTQMIVDSCIVQHYIDMAHAVVKKARWQELWTEGMRLFVAHHLTLYLKSKSDPTSGKTGIINAGGTSGAVASASVGGVSVSYDLNIANGDLSGWASYKLTIYGTQFATYARMLGKGGMYIG